MKIFSSDGFGKVHILRLDRGDYLLESIEKFIESESICNAAVVSGIGTFDNCVLHMVMTTGFPPVEHFEKWEDKPLELSSLSGIIANGVPHLHMVVSDHQYAYSGHVEHGCRILYLGEVVIAEMTNLNIHRTKNENNIWELNVKTEK